MTRILSGKETCRTRPVTVTYAPPDFRSSRAAGLPLVGNEVFDGHLRALRQVLDDDGELTVQVVQQTLKKYALPENCK